MNNLLKSFSDKRFKYGTFSTIIAVFVITILMVVNLVVSELNISYDLTPEKTYSLTDGTKEALAGLSEDVNIYALFETGVNDVYFDTFRELLDEYPLLSQHIKVEYKDPYLYPQFVEKYNTEEQSASNGSIIVETASRFKVIPLSKLVTQEYDYSTFESYVSSIDLEVQVTNTIRNLTSGSSSIIYVVNGHNEQPMSEVLTDKIETAGYEVKDINLFNQSEIPEDCSLLFVVTPERDWSAEEAQLVKTYLQNGGRAVFFVDYLDTRSPNLDSVLEAYGVAFTQGIVFEGDANNYFQGNPINLIPVYSGHTIASGLGANQYTTIIPMTMAVQELELKKSSTTVEPVLTTSKDAYLKTALSDSTSINKEPGDLEGPFTIAAAITGTTHTEASYETKIVVTAAETVLNESIDSFVQGANYAYVMNCINWTQDSEESIYISPKTSSQAALMMTASQAFTTIMLSLLLPVVIFIIGVVVWLRRRNS